MPTPIEAFRNKFGLGIAEIAASLGVSETQMRKWERRWEEMPPDMLREMAVIHGVTVSFILGKQAPVEEWGSLPFAINEREDLYGTLRITFSDGTAGKYPISEESRKSILRQLGRRSFVDCRSSPGEEPWLYFWTLDDRIAIARMALIAEIALLSDDEVAAPYYAHPEIYRLLATADPYEPLTVNGQATAAAMATHFDIVGSEEAAIQQATHALIVFTDGRELYSSCSNPDEAVALFALDLCAGSISNSTFLQIEDPNDYDEAYFVNMDALRFVSIPSEAYHRHTAPETGGEDT